MGEEKGKRYRRRREIKKEPENGKGLNEITYVKFRVTFRCSKEECQHTWISNHGWREEVFCDFCGFKSKIMDVKDENMELDNYECPQGHRWQSIHDDNTNDQECEECGSLGEKDGSQIRFGRHFWFKCGSTACAVEWEDHSLTPQRTQRCAASTRLGGNDGTSIKCGGRGDIVKFERIVKKKRTPSAEEAPKPEDGFSTSNGGRPRFGRHNPNLCDMCQDLRSEGYSGTCRRYRKVLCEVVDAGGEVFDEKITAAVEA